MAQIRFDSADADKLQEEMWAAEAAVHGKTLTLPPQKDRNKARQTDKKDPKSLKNKERKFGEIEEGHIPGVGSSPTAELEDDGMDASEQREGTVDKDKTVADTEVVFCGPS